MKYIYIYTYTVVTIEWSVTNKYILWLFYFTYVRCLESYGIFNSITKTGYSAVKLWDFFTSQKLNIIWEGNFKSQTKIKINDSLLLPEIFRFLDLKLSNVWIYLFLWNKCLLKLLMKHIWSYFLLNLLSLHEQMCLQCARRYRPAFCCTNFGLHKAMHCYEIIAVI